MDVRCFYSLERRIKIKMIRNHTLFSRKVILSISDSIIVSS